MLNCARPNKVKIKELWCGKVF